MIMSNDNEQVSHLSPKWKRPGEVMRKMYLRKKPPPLRSSSLSLDSVSTSDKQPLKTVKNPFAKKRLNSEPIKQKKKRIILINEDASSGDLLDLEETQRLSFFHTIPDDSSTLQDNNSLDFVYLNEDSFVGQMNVNKDDDNVNSKSFRKLALPIDWTLKAKARFMSPSTFAWCARMKGAEEAVGISRASSCLHCDKPLPQTNAENRVQLERNLLYWQHPCVPWFTLFPRYGTDTGLMSSSSGEPMLPESARLSLYDSWVVAFRSIYQLLRQDLCPFFYICSQQYTALFRSSSLSPSKQVSCLLSPTSLGFRRALTGQGIEHTMPLRPTQTDQPPASETNQIDATIRKLKGDGSLKCPFPPSRPGDLFDDNVNSQSANLRGKVSPKAEDSGEDNDDSDDELQWKDISENLSFRKSKSVTKATTEDGLPSTVVLVEGFINTQLLFNYLLNSRSSISTSGRQAGMPPTILSPVPFNGAALRKLECRSGVAKIRTDSIQINSASNSDQLMANKQFSLDLTGPVMPHHLSGLVTLLEATQTDGEFSCSCNVFSYTSPFNARSKKPEVVTDEMSPEARDRVRSSVAKFDCDAPPVTLRKFNALNQTYDWEE